MPKRYICMVMALMMAFMLPGCAAQNNLPAFKAPESVDATVSGSLAAFSLDLFKRTATQDSGVNVFISPLSVWLALGMLYNGASGTTADGMAQALHASGVSTDTLNNTNAGLMGLLQQADPKVQVNIANSVWMRTGFDRQVNKEFLDVNRNFYGAAIQSLDFGSVDAAPMINEWVKGKTGGRIMEIVSPPIGSDTMMYLINAVYFKAPWKNTFNPKWTESGSFTLADGTKVETDFMEIYEGLSKNGYADKDVSIVRLPYASGRLEMVAVMPKKQTLITFIQKLDLEALNVYIKQCTDTKVALSFPKFKVEYGTDLNDVLIHMGMKDAFGEADFSAMSKTVGKQLSLSDVKHKSFIEVNEQGTEAGAVTSIAVDCAAPDAIVNLFFDRPFIYLIRDTVTGTILFIGAMENPAA